MPKTTNKLNKFEQIKQLKKPKKDKWKKKYNLTDGEIKDILNGFTVEVEADIIGYLLILRWSKHKNGLQKIYKMKPLKGDYMGNSEDSNDEDNFNDFYEEDYSSNSYDEDSYNDSFEEEDSDY